MEKLLVIHQLIEKSWYSLGGAGNHNFFHMINVVLTAAYDSDCMCALRMLLSLTQIKVGV